MNWLNRKCVRVNFGSPGGYWSSGKLPLCVLADACLLGRYTESPLRVDAAALCSLRIQGVAILKSSAETLECVLLSCVECVLFSCVLCHRLLRCPSTLRSVKSCCSFFFSERGGRIAKSEVQDQAILLAYGGNLQVWMREEWIASLSSTEEACKLPGGVGLVQNAACSMACSYAKNLLLPDLGCTRCLGTNHQSLRVPQFASLVLARVEKHR
ncbi:hypothetical protein KP509_25G023500 [Ceratopteris richardii]|uniref:Uncharacterized protein n=1 Tax=Ceratopteris richardii TaxID=49495 RepID=A0A8T2RNK0_CERRI|nr:hypothetical protein KP509_25G023500 [Ceratopteris richardii]